ncbi:MAG TPA: MotA/TolQ/ExbB proton channel family protein [Nevskiaceae bacterium]|nr:MotA/TolQ/ExbB proton channel family protein [Nevskiaceae bacterium]
MSLASLIPAIAAPLPTAPVNLSIQHLVMQADPVVKIILAILVIFSFWCWAVVIEKMIEVTSANKAAQRLDEALQQGDVDHMLRYQDEHPVADIVAAGNEEWRAGPGENVHESLSDSRDRIERAMRLALSVELRRLNLRIPFLATIGSAAPFIGLFGTVWGIMNTFVGIGASHDTSLSTVGPGIAEALIATAIGLVAAIPAVMAYNKFATDIGRYSGRISTAIGIYAGRLSKRRLPEV